MTNFRLPPKVWASLLVIGATAYAVSDCTNAIYRGFDSRLIPAIIGRLPVTKDQVVGFEIVRGTPTVAYPDRLVALREGEGRSLTVRDKITGIAVDASGHLRVQTPGAVQSLNSSGVVPDAQLGANVKGRLLGSGSDVFLDAKEQSGTVQFDAVRPDGAKLPIVSAKGRLSAASWDKEGLAAILDDSLLLWEAGASKFMLLRQDAGLHAAKDVCLVGHNRAVVALPDVVLLITENSQTVIAGFGAACRWQNGTLYLLDARSGLVWSVVGLEKLRGKNDNIEFAKQLVNALPAGANQTSPRFLEAARLVGCREAQKLLQQQQK